MPMYANTIQSGANSIYGMVPMDGVGKLDPGGGSCWEILNYIFIKKTVLVVGEDLVYFSL